MLKKGADAAAARRRDALACVDPSAPETSDAERRAVLLAALSLRLFRDPAGAPD